MKCPACFNDLKELQVGSVVVDVCRDGCGGVWFDAFEMKRVNQEEKATAESLLDVPRDPAVVVDPTRKRECPRCTGVKLHRHFFSAQRQVQVDQCPNCGGYWLDAGELAVIREEQRSEADAARSDGSTIISREVIRYIYELQLQVQAKKARSGLDTPESA